MLVGLLSCFFSLIKGESVMTKYVKSMGLLCLVLMLSACANTNSSKESMAVLQWDKVVKAHPDYPRLELGEKILGGIVARRDNSAMLAKSQMESVERLRGLKQLSELSYYEAELHTQMAEQAQINKGKSFKYRQGVKKQVEEEFASQQNAISDEYLVRLFNLRLERDRIVQFAKGKPGPRLSKRLEQLDAQIDAIKLERDGKLLVVQQEKDARINGEVKSYEAQLRNEMQADAAKKWANSQQRMAQKEGKYDKLMSSAPLALEKALAVMDKEILAQKNKNAELQKKIDADIAAVVEKQAKEKNYEVVFKEYKVNISAVDITDSIIAEFKKNNK